MNAMADEVMLHLLGDSCNLYTGFESQDFTSPYCVNSTITLNLNNTTCKTVSVTYVCIDGSGTFRVKKHFTHIHTVRCKEQRFLISRMD